MLEKIRVPTLIVWGQDDRIVPVEGATMYQQAIPGAQLEILEQCGHFWCAKKVCNVAASRCG